MNGGGARGGTARRREGHQTIWKTDRRRQNDWQRRSGAGIWKRIVGSTIGGLDCLTAKTYDLITLLSWRKSGVFEAHSLVVALASYQKLQSSDERAFATQAIPIGANYRLTLSTKGGTG